MDLFRVAVLALALALWAPRAFALSEDDFQPIAPLLIDLPGWEGNLVLFHAEPDGSGGFLSRSYTRADAEIELQLFVGPEAKNYLGGMLPGVRLMESDALRLERVRMGSRDVVLRREKGAGASSGSVAVPLSAAESILLVLSYDGIEERDAMETIGRLDLDEIARRAPHVP